MKQNSFWRKALSCAAIVAGNALYSLAVAIFLVPSGLITGGATGIALAVNRACGLPASATLLIINLAMLAWGWAVLGRAFALSTAASSVLGPAFLALFERVLAGRVLTDDLFLCTVFAGIGIGFALGIVIRAGASTGGMDIPPLVLQKWFKLPVSATMSALDLIILAAQARQSTVPQALYGVVLVIILTIVLDKMLLLGTTRTEVKIISPKAGEIREAIMRRLDRGVTVLYGEGGYTREPATVLLIVISNRELPKLESLVRGIDPASFMIVARVSEVSGRGFSLDRNYDM